MINDGDIFKFVLTWSIGGATIAQNTYHYLADTDDPNSTYQDVLVALVLLQTTTFGTIDQLIASNVEGTFAELLYMDPISKLFSTVASTPVTGMKGTATGTQLPNGVAVLCKFFTDIGRSQGRKYLPGYNETDAKSNELGTGDSVPFLAWATGIITPIVVGLSTLSPGNFSTITKLVRLYTGIVAVNDLLAYQRRRKPGVGI